MIQEAITGLVNTAIGATIAKQARETTKGQKEVAKSTNELKEQFMKMNIVKPQDLSSDQVKDVPMSEEDKKTYENLKKKQAEENAARKRAPKVSADMKGLVNSDMEPYQKKIAAKRLQAIEEDQRVRDEIKRLNDLKTQFGTTTNEQIKGKSEIGRL